MKTKHYQSYGFGSGPRVLSEETFEEDVDDYVKAARAYLRARHDYAAAKAFVRPVPIALVNKGTAQIRNVTVEIELPSNIRAATEDEMDWYNDKDGNYMPEAPEQPTATFLLADLAAGRRYRPDSPLDRTPHPPEPEDIRGPHFAPRQEKEIVRYSLPVVTAGQRIDNLDPFYLMLSGVDQDTELALNVKIFADALHQPQIAVLHLLVRATEEKVDTAA